MKKILFPLSGRRAYGLALACVVVAVGAIVLLKARRQAGAAAQPIQAPFDLSSASPAAADAPRVTFEHPGVSGSLAFTQGALEARGLRRVFAELALDADGAGGATTRQPVALTVALDISGSMTGEKLEEARVAVTSLLEEMHAEDLVSVVVYNDSALLLQPLAPVSRERQRLIATISALQAGGGTNIPAALELAAAQAGRAGARYVRRTVLVSDGLDHSGWQPSQITALVRSAADQGDTLSTLGVGTDYSEHLMTGIADAGRGNYAFLARGSDLSPFLHRELEQAAQTVVDNLVATLALPPGWQLVEAQGAGWTSTRQGVDLAVGALFAGDQRRVNLAFEVEAGGPGRTLPVELSLAYRHTPTLTAQGFAVGRLALAVTESRAQVVASTDLAAHTDAVTATVDAQQALNIEAWRQGHRDRAISQTFDNITTLQQLQAQAYSQDRAERIAEFQRDVDNFRQNEASSQVGRTYGLRSNDLRRQRAWSSGR